MQNTIKIAGLIAAVLTVGGCNDSTDYDFGKSVTDAKAAYAEQTLADTANVKAIFSPASGILPSSSDLHFTGSTDGTLNLPISEFDTDGAKALKAQLNTLDGSSTVNPITTTFSTTLDSDSVVLGSSVIVMELTTTGGTVTGVAKSFSSPAEMIVTLTGTNNTTLAIVPTTPLKPATKYFVILTDDLKGSDGTAVKPDTTYALTKRTEPLTGDFTALEPLRQATQALEGLAASAGIDKDKIILSWTFTTQSMGATLQALADANNASTFAVASTGLNTKQILDPTSANPGVFGNADIYAGTISLPYYLNAANSTSDAAPLAGSWAVDATSKLPGKTTDVTVPVLISAPNSGTEPADGWPVVMFQHGITANRTSLLGIAETLAAAGFVGVAIDMPLHGLDAGHALAIPGAERTFALDLANNTTGASGPDGTADSSGTHYINLVSLLTSRDNVRQSVADLMVVRDSLETLDAVINVDEDTVRFIGHSLGGMVGTNFLAFEDNVGAATLAMPGGSIPQILRASPSFSPVINAGLAANGIDEGTEAYASFFGAAQWILDAADPINHAAAAASKHPIHMIEVVGGNSSLSDQVIPNNVATAPLAGTDPLARIMGLTDTTITATGANLHVLTQFNVGDHSSILSPAASLAATIEMQTQTASFMASNGTALPITDGTVIAD